MMRDYELRIQTANLDEFEEELRAFAARYISSQIQPDIEQIIIEKGKIRDQAYRPVHHSLTRVFAVDLYRRKNEWTNRETIDGPTFFITQRGNALLLSFTNAYLAEAHPFVLAFIERCKTVWGISALQTNPTHHQSTQQNLTTHPTDRTRERFEVFEQLKREHTDWTQARVARAACDKLSDPNITEETVGDVYKAMGVSWPRGKRTR